MTSYILLHVAISLVAIVSGFVVAFGLLAAKKLDGWTMIFLSATILTNFTGFLFPFHGFTPALGTGIVSMAVLAMAIYGRYGRRLAGVWRMIYVIGALLALYLNVFVLIVQSFQKIPALKEIAPTPNDPVFQLTQLAILILFLIWGLLAVMRFRDTSVQQTLPRKTNIQPTDI